MQASKLLSTLKKVRKGLLYSAIATVCAVVPAAYMGYVHEVISVFLYIIYAFVAVFIAEIVLTSVLKTSSHKKNAGVGKMKISADDLALSLIEALEDCNLAECLASVAEVGYEVAKARYGERAKEVAKKYLSKDVVVDEGEFRETFENFLVAVRADRVREAKERLKQVLKYELSDEVKLRVLGKVIKVLIATGFKPDQQDAVYATVNRYIELLT